MKKKLQTIILLFIPIIIGIIIRLIGIEHGKPDMIYHPDVAKQVNVAVNTCKHKHITPRKIFGDDDFQHTLYPYGTAIITGNVMSAISDITKIDFPHKHRWNWALYMRYLSTILFMLSAAAAMWFLLDRTTIIPAILAGLLLVSEPINSQYSHYAMNDVPLTAMFIFAWILSSLIIKEHSKIPIFSILCGLVLGMAFDIKYQAVIGGIFPFITWVFLTKEKGKKWLFISISSVIIGGIIGILLLNPMLRTEPLYFMEKFPLFMKWQANIMGYKIEHSIKIPNNIILLASHLKIAGILLTIIGLYIGLFCVIRKKTDPKNMIPVISAISFCITLIILFVVTRDFVRNNDIIPLLSFSALLTAFVLVQFPPKRNLTLKRKILSLTLYSAVIGIIISFIFISIADSMALTGDDTRMQAWKWCRENIPKNSYVISERYTLPIRRTDITETHIRYIKPYYTNYNFVILSSKAYNRFFDKHSPYYSKKAQKRYIEINKRLDKVKEFKRRELYFANPKITIYRNHEKS